MNLFLYLCSVTTSFTLGSSKTELEPASPQAAFTPKAKTFTELGVATDTFLNRDSCGSSKFGNRTLWTCRDTQFVMPDGLPQLKIISSTASWADDPGHTDCAQPLPSNVLRLYGDQNGKAFFPLLDDECNSNEAGMCDDNGGRFSIWPDVPPLVARTGDDGAVTAYTWIRKFRVDKNFEPVHRDPATTLYRVEYSPGGDRNLVPSVAVADPEFYADGEVSYGNYGNFVVNGTAYLYGQPSTRAIALARVPADRIEDKSQYEYFVGGNWTTAKPAMSNPLINIPNASAGGQGTYYFSAPWGRYVWIGQSGFSVAAEFFITTSPRPEGPWEPPVMFYQGANGNFSLGSYSLQAHPGLVEAGCNEIVISWTRNDLVGTELNVYTTPLVRVTWV